MTYQMIIPAPEFDSGAEKVLNNIFLILLTIDLYNQIFLLSEFLIKSIPVIACP